MGKKNVDIEKNIIIEEQIDNDTVENIKTAFFLNLIFSIVEVVGGFLTHSIAIISDAIHDFGDSVSIGIAYILEKKSKKSPNKEYTYGYLRYSLLGALITCFVLLTGSIVVIMEAVPKLFHPNNVNHDAMIIFAIFGVLINGYAAFKTSKGKKTNEKTINLHMLEDVFGWVAILIGSIFIKLFGYTIIDPILSLLIAIYILYHVYKNLKEVFDIFMEKVPKDIKIDFIEKSIIEKCSSVKNIHHVHVWSIDGVNNCMTAHILLNDDFSKEEIINIKNNIKEILRENKIEHVTLEIEYFDENCHSKKCK